jgi:hypothetical protein
MIAVAVILMTWREVTVIAVSLGLLLVLFIEVVIYVAHDYSLPRWLFSLNIILALLGMVAPPLACFYIGTFPTFIGFSASAWFLALALLSYGYLSILTSLYSGRPYFLSPWVYPCFRFDPRRGELLPSNSAPLSLCLGYLVLIGWAVLATVWLTPVHLGVALSILVTCLFLLTLMWLA